MHTVVTDFDKSGVVCIHDVVLLVAVDRDPSYSSHGSGLQEEGHC